MFVSDRNSLLFYSQTFRDILHQEYQVPIEKINIIPGGVDIDRFNINLSPTEARSQLGWHHDHLSKYYFETTLKLLLGNFR